MGSVSLKIGDGTARFRRATLCSSALHIVMLASVIFTNLFALFAFTRPIPPSRTGAGGLLPAVELEQQQHRLISDQVALILREIEESQRHLSQIERDLLGYDTFDAARPGTPPELKVFLARHPLPLGRDVRTGITEMLSSVGHSCVASRDLLARYATYDRGGECPAAADVGGLADKLLARGCEPLPRRRCLSRPTPRPGLVPFPESLWAPVSDSISAAWKAAAFDKVSWVRARGKTEFLMEDVLALGAAGSGGIRTGLDVNGGVGNFAARMAEKGVTVVTSTTNPGGKPISEVVAGRGLFPLHLTTGQRFPFSDSVFDLVHTVTGLNDEAAAATMVGWQERLEFLLFDMDRVLRPGGLLWVDNYQCLDNKRKSVLTALIEKFGYKKLKWVMGDKADPGGADGKPKVYISAVLQKPGRA